MKRVLLVGMSGLILIAGGDYAAQTPAVLAKFRRHPGERIPGKYIVVLRADPSSASTVSEVADELSRRHGGERLHSYTHALRGYAARVSEAVARRLSEDPRVAYVEEDGVTRAAAIQTAPANWGLDRSDERALPVDGKYIYFADGTGVNVYVVDSGIRVTHHSFGGRAAGAYSAVADGIPADEDCHGHGTHVAGIIGSSAYGVAKKARLFSVRALPCDGIGSLSDYIKAVDWVVAHHVKPAVINASISGGMTTAGVDSIRRAVAAGVTFVGSAGNDSVDACSQMPGAAAEAIIVGNAASDDSRPSSSNYGACIDLFAPGTAITSSSHWSDTGYVDESGTSMAAPHVAGAAALYLQRRPGATPAQVTAEILRGTTTGVLTNVGQGSPNRLLFTRYLGDTTAPAVRLTSPAPGAVVSGAIAISAAASDGAELQGVRFYVGSTQIRYDTAAPYTVTWNSGAVADATHTIRARAVDLAGNTNDSAVSVFVRNNDIQPPKVAVTFPLPGAELAGTVVLKATATDDRAVASVEFSVDGALAGKDSAAPFVATWDTTAFSNGAHTVVARAFDTSGNSKLSTPVAVYVNNTTASGPTLPAGWTSTDVGAVGIAGRATHANGTFTLHAGGTDIWSTSDAFHFAYRSWTGDADIVARVGGLPLPAGASFAMAGVMLRESLAANARHASLLIGTNGKLKFRRRIAVGGATLSDGPSEGSLSVPYWLKVTRRGNVFTAYRSAEGRTWTQVGPSTTLALPATLHVGLWTLRKGGTARAQGTFTGVSLSTAGGH